MSENYIYLDCEKINISDETAENFRKEFGEYQFKHGDVAKTGWGKKRIIVKDGAGLVSRDKVGDVCCSGQESFARNGYKKISNVFTD